MTKKDIHIVLSSSKEFLSYCCTTIISILENLPEDTFAHFYILSFDIDEKSKKKVEKIKKIKNCTIEYPEFAEKMLDVFNGINLPQHVTKMTYARILIPEILPHLDKALFIDSDTLVRKDISQLYEVDLGEDFFGAVQDVSDKSLSMRLWGKQNNYFNGGVLLLNCKQMRKEAFIDKIKLITNARKKEYLICDQDVLNDVFYGRIKRLSYRWNFFHEWHICRNVFVPIEQSDYDDSLNNPSIIHYVGPDKPWYSKSKHPYKKEYLKYYRKNPFLKFNIFKYERYKMRYDEYIHLKFCGQNIITLRNNVLFMKTYFCGIPVYEYDYQHNKKYWVNKILGHYIREIYDRFIRYPLFNKYTFYKYKDLYNGKDAVIVASGPSVKKYNPKKDVIHIGVNGAFKLDNISLDYLFMQDISGLNYIDELLADKYSGIKLFFGSLIFDKNPSLFPLNKLCPFPKDYFHRFKAIKYYIRNTNNGKFKKIDTYLEDMGSTVFIPVLFALHAGFKNIYLVGCDCSNGHFYKNDKEKVIDMSVLTFPWLMLKAFAERKYPNSRIVSINPVGLKGVFDEEYTE